MTAKVQAIGGGINIVNNRNLYITLCTSSLQSEGKPKKCFPLVTENAPKIANRCSISLLPFSRFMGGMTECGCHFRASIIGRLSRLHEIPHHIKVEERGDERGETAATLQLAKTQVPKYLVRK